MYDCLTLLNIRETVACFLSLPPGQWSLHWALHLEIPGNIWAPSCCCSWSRRARRRSRQARATVNHRESIRACIQSRPLTIPTVLDPGIRLSCLRPVSPAQQPAPAPVFPRHPLTSVASVPAYQCPGLHPGCLYSTPPLWSLFFF